ncbi:major facilitator superfamily domain containing protein [Rhypophila decipiens]
MENRRALPAWRDSEPIEALQQATYAMVAATESMKRQLQTTAHSQEPGVLGAAIGSGTTLSPSAGDSSTDRKDAIQGRGILSPPEAPMSVPRARSDSTDRHHVDHQVSRQTVLRPGLLSSRYGNVFSESSESLEARLGLVQISGSSSTLVPSPDVKAGIDLQYPQLSYKGSPPPKTSPEVSDGSRATHRHSSYEPGSRRGPIALFNPRQYLSQQTVEEDSIKLMAPELGASQNPYKSDPPAPKQPAGFTFWQEIWFVLIIGRSFPDSNPGVLAWYSAAYGLTSATFVLPSGRLGDLFGHRMIFLIGCVWFSLWSLAAGFAPGVQSAGHNGNVYFCFCRAMQGIGPSLLVPNGQAMLGRTYPPGPRKNTVLCLFGASAPLGFVMGGIVASLFAEYGSWPWAFWLMAIMCAGLGVMGSLALPRPGASKRQSQDSFWVQLDGFGMILGVSGLVLVNFAVNQAPIVSWSTPYVYFLLIIGILLTWWFILHECSSAKYPLVPISALTSTTNFVLGCTAAGWGCFGIWIYYSFAILEGFRGWSPLKSCIHFTPAPITGLAASFLAGYMIMRVKPHWIMLVSMLAFFLGSVLFAAAPLGETYWLRIFLSILIMPFYSIRANHLPTRRGWT